VEPRLELDDYRDVSRVGVDPDKMSRLLSAQTEACVMWTTTQHWPVGVMHRFVWAQDRFWITCASHRKRITAWQRRPQGAVSVSSEGTYLGGDINVVAKTLVTVHDAAERRDLAEWFYPALARRQRRDDPDGQVEFLRRMDTPGRSIVELVPVQWITYDGNRLEAALTSRPYDPSTAKPSRNLLLRPDEEC
jgi:hypothetical protein